MAWTHGDHAAKDNYSSVSLLFWTSDCVSRSLPRDSCHQYSRFWPLAEAGGHFNSSLGDQLSQGLPLSHFIQSGAENFSHLIMPEIYLHTRNKLSGGTFFWVFALPPPKWTYLSSLLWGEGGKWTTGIITYVYVFVGSPRHQSRGELHCAKHYAKLQ